jgi:hypothetical protein
LVDHSLVQSEPAGGESMRYRMLEPFRQYGAARLAAAGDRELIRCRHAEHFLWRSPVGVTGSFVATAVWPC